MTTLFRIVIFLRLNINNKFHNIHLMNCSGSSDHIISDKVYYNLHSFINRINIIFKFINNTPEFTYSFLLIPTAFS